MKVSLDGGETYVDERHKQQPNGEYKMPMSQERRNINASEARPKAIQVLDKTDFKRFMGSGFNVQITKLDGTALCPEFVINGEDMCEIAPNIVKSLREALKLHRLNLLRHLREVEEAMGLKAPPSTPDNNPNNGEQK